VGVRLKASKKVTIINKDRTTETISINRGVCQADSSQWENKGVHVDGTY